MQFNFKIEFSGLCAFVPEQSFGEKVGQKVTVLVPDALKARPVHPTGAVPLPLRETDQLILPPHLPMLIFDHADLQSPGGAPPFTILGDSQAGDDERKGVFLMIRQDVEIQPDRKDGVELFNPEVPDPLNPRSDDEKKSLFWLAKIDDVLGAHRRIEPRLLGALDDREEEVISRVVLNTGRLRAEPPTTGLWQFLPIDEPIRDTRRERPVASKIVLEVPAVDQAAIVVRSFGEEGAGQRFVFAPREDATEVTVQIVNLEPDLLLGVPVSPHAPVPDVDPDFSIYYNLIDGFGDKEPRPILRRRLREGNGFISGESKPCAPMGVNRELALLS